MEKRATIEFLLRKSVHYFNIDFKEKQVLDVPDHLLVQLKEKDPEWHRLMANIIQAWSLFDYIKKDRELKIKMSDVWETEVTRLSQN